jgi:hypothetical protein
MGWSEKLQLESRLMTGDGLGCGIVFETLLKDPFNAINIENFETECSLTSGVKPVGAVAFG